jgi:two-component system, cell cycle response regulator DivK
LTALGQNPLLPRRNIAGRFTSSSGHYARRRSAVQTADDAPMRYAAAELSCALSHFRIDDNKDNLCHMSEPAGLQTFRQPLPLSSFPECEKPVDWGMTKRILLVEDQEDNRRIIRDLLTKTDYEMIEARNGVEGVMVAGQGPPDLILMDIQLPVMNGYDATRCIRADPSLSSIPIIAVTSYVLSGGEEKARAAGCDDVVAKPYSPLQLLAKIYKFLP